MPTTVGEALERLCQDAVRALPAAGAGVCMMSPAGGVMGVAAASDATSRELEELQFSMGEGPCVDAFALRRPVYEPDLVTPVRSRWPGYAPAACERGVLAVFAFPLQVGDACVGVLDVYRRQTGALSPESTSQALTFADYALHTLLNGHEAAGDDRSPGDLGHALDYRVELYQAQGMTMIDLGVGLDEAMARLRAHAFATERDLGAVARDVITGRLRLEVDHA